jgi:hypothetical protein
MEIERLVAFLDSSPTVRLMRADQAAFVICFLRKTLKLTSEESAISLSHEELQDRLMVFQEQLRDDGYGGSCRPKRPARIIN